MPVEVRTLAEWEADGMPGMLSVRDSRAQRGRAHRDDGARPPRGARRPLAIPHEILVVNDNSSDGTERRPRSGSAPRLPSVRYVNNAPPNGFGFAVRAGLAAFRGDAVAIVMADGSDNPRTISWRSTARCRRATTASSDRGSCAARA